MIYRCRFFKKSSEIYYVHHPKKKFMKFTTLSFLIIISDAFSVAGHEPQGSIPLVYPRVSEMQDPVLSSFDQCTLISEYCMSSKYHFFIQVRRAPEPGRGGLLPGH